MIAWLLSIAPWLGRLSGLGRFFTAQWKIGLIVLAAASIGVLWWRLDNAGETITDLKVEVATYQRWYESVSDANATLQDSLSALRASNEELRAAVEVSEEKRREAEAAAAQRAAEAEERLNNALDELERLRAEDPSCEEIARLDVSAYCPGSVERLRELSRARADNQD